jgi:hypothetical protein
MAWLKSETAKTWPGFAEWLKGDFVHVLNNTTVINAFYKWFRPPDDAPIPGITNNPDYHRLASNDEADWVIRFGNSPEIQIMSMGCRTTNPGSNEKNGTRPPAMHYALTGKFGIVLNQDVVALVEYAKTKTFPKVIADSGVIDLIKSVTQKMSEREVFEFAEATILHELIHWRHWVLGLEANTTGGQKDYIERTYGSDEAPSYAFEREAYGRIMSLPIQICNASNTDQ